jgi:hypothetical protein
LEESRQAFVQVVSFFFVENSKNLKKNPFFLSNILLWGFLFGFVLFPDRKSQV